MGASRRDHPTSRAPPSAQSVGSRTLGLLCGGLWRRLARRRALDHGRVFACPHVDLDAARLLLLRLRDPHLEDALVEARLDAIRVDARWQRESDSISRVGSHLMSAT